MATKTSNDTELKYIRRDLDELKKTTTDGFQALINQGFVKRDELKEKIEDIYQTMKYEDDKTRATVETNRKDYDEFSRFFKNLNYALILALLMAVVGLILKLK